MNEVTTPPEARLLSDRRRAKDLSVEEVSKLSGVSISSAWIAFRGYRTRDGRQVEAKTGAAGLVKIAIVLGIEPAELRAVGRDDAADALADLKSVDLRAISDEALLDELKRRLDR